MALGLTILSLLLIVVVSIEAAAIHKQPKQDWVKITREEMKRAQELQPVVGEAKNVIMFMGDGMGITSNTISRVYYSQTTGVSLNEARFSFERFPYVGLAMTYSLNTMTTGSGTAGTSLMSGEKVPHNTIGVNQEAVWKRCDTESNNKIYSAFYHCAQAGKSTGIVTNTRVTHASPAAAYAHTIDRKWESDAKIPEDARGVCADIAKQLIDEGDFLDVIMGGGRTKFLPNTTFDPEYPNKKGERRDQTDLIQVWKDKQPAGKKYVYVDRLEDFKKINPEEVDKVLALFEPSHMHYETDRQTSENKWAEPSLTEMTEMAINILKKNDKGFCLFVESGRIDHAHHKTNAYRAITDTIEFSNAVAKGVEMTDIKDTLSITTADHSMPITMSGYTGINTNVLGLASKLVEGSHAETEIVNDGLPYGVISYAIGPPPSYIYHKTNASGAFPIKGRRNLTQDVESGDAFKKDYLQFGPIPRYDMTHSGEDVGIYAQGPMAHLFHTVHENTFIAHVMMYASCVGPYKDDCVKHNTKDIKKCPVDPDMMKGTANDPKGAGFALRPPFTIVIFVIFCLLALMRL